MIENSDNNKKIADTNNANTKFDKPVYFSDAFKYPALFVAVGLILTAGFYFSTQYKPMGQNKSLDLADWQTYRNDEFGFEVKLPPDWYVKVSEQGGDSISFWSQDLEDAYDDCSRGQETDPMLRCDMGILVLEEVLVTDPYFAYRPYAPLSSVSAVELRQATYIPDLKVQIPSRTKANIGLVFYLYERSGYEDEDRRNFDQILATFRFSDNNFPTSQNVQVDEGLDGLLLLSPNGGEILKFGETQMIKWNDSRGLADGFGIFLQSTESIPWKTATIETNIQSSESSYFWIVPSDGSITPGNKYKILITASIKGSTKMGLTDGTDGFLILE